MRLIRAKQQTEDLLMMPKALAQIYYEITTRKWIGMEIPDAE